MLKKLISFAVLTRPLNVLIAFLTIIVAAMVAGSLQPFSAVVVAAVTASLITAGANIINDYYDVEIDKVNKPQRPLASEQISKKEALIFFMIVYLIAWILAAFLGAAMFIIVFIFSILLFFYSYKLKPTVIWGNVTVSISTGMAFIYGGMAVNRVEYAIFPALFGFFFHFGREIIKDIQDIKGDSINGARTFPVKYGIRKSLILMTIIFIMLIILTLIPYLMDIYSFIYLVIVVAGVHLVILYVMLSCWLAPNPVNLGKMSTLLKVDMFIGLIAIYFG